MGSSQEWFLEVDGKKVGPFSAEHVLGLLEDQEIQENQRVITESLKGKWITVSELRAMQIHPAKSFTPPPRPPDLSPSTSADASTAAPIADPAVSLFEAIQAAKDRKAIAARIPPSDSSIVVANPLSFKNIPPKAWMIAGLTLLLITATWGMVHFIRTKSPSPVAATQRTTPQTPAPPTPPQPAIPHANRFTGGNVIPPPPPPPLPLSRPAFAPPPPPPPPLNSAHDRDAAPPQMPDLHMEEMPAGDPPGGLFNHAPGAMIPPPFPPGGPPGPLPDQPLENPAYGNPGFNNGEGFPPPPPGPLE